MFQHRRISGYRRMMGLVGAGAVWLAVLAGPVAGQNPPQVDPAVKKLMAANGLFQRGMYGLAAEEYAEFLDKHADHEHATTARYALAVCHYRQANHDKAIVLIEQALKDRQFDKRDEALAVLGHACMTTGKLDRALGALNELLDQHADSPHAEVSALNRAQVLYMKGDRAKALQAAEQFVKKHPDSAQVPAGKYLAALSEQALGQHAEAVKRLKDLLARHKDAPQRDDATLLLGQAYEGQGKFDQAVGQFRQFIKIAPGPRKGDGLYSLGVVLYRQGKFDQAVEELDTLLERDPENRYAAAGRMQKGLALLGAGKTDAARKIFQEVEKKDEDRRLAARYWLAQCDIADRQFVDARKQLEALSKHDPPPVNMHEVAFGRAICTLALEEFDAAARQFADFVKQHPKDPRVAEAEYRRAFALHRKGDHEASLKQCRAIDKPGAFAQQIDELVAENLFLLRKYDEAEEALAKLVDRSGWRDASQVLRYGQCAYFTGDYKQTVERLTKLATAGDAKQDPVRVAIFLVGDANLQLAKHDEAVAALEHYLSLAEGEQDEAKLKLAVARLRSGDVNNAEKALGELTQGSVESTWTQRALLEYGQLQRKQGDRDEAAKALKKLADYDKAPDALRAPAEYLLAWNVWEQRQLDEAVKRFEQVYKRYADHDLAADARFQRGACLQDAGQFAEAHDQLNDYLKRHRDGKHLDAARYRMAVCLSRQKKFAEAIKAFEQLAKDADQRSARLWYELAWAHRGAKHNDEAIKAYRRLLDEFGNDELVSSSRQELAELLYLGGKYDEAMGLLKQVLADRDADRRTHTVAAYRLAWCHTKLDEHERAAEAFADFADKYDDKSLVASALYQSGQALARLDRHDKARDQFEKLLKRLPDHDLAPVARLKLGEMLAELGEHAQAEAAYRQYLKTRPDGQYRYLAQFGIGWALENREKPADARQWYAKVVEGHNGPTAARAQFQIGETYFTEKQYHRAARELLKVEIVYAYPQWSARALYEAARAFEQVGETDQARRQYEQCVKKYKDQPVAELAAKALAAMGDG